MKKINKVKKAIKKIKSVLGLVEALGDLFKDLHKNILSIIGIFHLFKSEPTISIVATVFIIGLLVAAKKIK